MWPRVSPSVSARKESVSVPWTLVPRNPDGYAGIIAATVLPCDEFPNSVLVDPYGPNVVVAVTRRPRVPASTPARISCPAPVLSCTS